MSPSGAISSADIAGPLEQSYRDRSAAFRAASDSTRLTPTHWHIAIANGLRWGFDGMDGVIFALATPLVIKDLGVTLPEYRSGLQIALLVGMLMMQTMYGDPARRRVFQAADAERGERPLQPFRYAQSPMRQDAVVAQIDSERAIHVQAKCPERNARPGEEPGQEGQQCQ